MKQKFFKIIIIIRKSEFIFSFPRFRFVDIVVASSKGRLLSIYRTIRYKSKSLRWNDKNDTKPRMKVIW